MEHKEHYCRVLQLHIREVPRTDHHFILTDDFCGLSYSLQTDVCLTPGHCATSLILVHSSLTVLKFGAVDFVILRASLNKQRLFLCLNRAPGSVYSDVVLSGANYL